MIVLIPLTVAWSWKNPKHKQDGLVQHSPCNVSLNADLHRAPMEYFLIYLDLTKGLPQYAWTMSMAFPWNLGALYKLAIIVNKVQCSFIFFFCCTDCSDHHHQHHHHHHHHHPHHQHQETYMEEVPLKPPKAKKPVADGVAIIDCTPYCRHFGLTSPWFRRVWFVKDICGLVSSTDCIYNY